MMVGRDINGFKAGPVCENCQLQWRMTHDSDEQSIDVTPCLARSSASTLSVQPELCLLPRTYRA
jgi:hypothetical protein